MSYISILFCDAGTDDCILSFSDEAVPPIEEKEASNPAKLLVQHALVARFLQQDISHTGGGSPRQRSQVKFVSPEDEDAASEDQPKKVEATAPPPLERHNLTVCALIPNEQVSRHQ